MTAGVVGFCTGIDFRFFVALLLRITMALSGHIREMKMVRLLVPVDSRFRGNDGVGLPAIFIAMT